MSKSSHKYYFSDYSLFHSLLIYRSLLLFRLATRVKSRQGERKDHPSHHLFLSFSDVTHNSFSRSSYMDQYLFSDLTPVYVYVKPGNLKLFEVSHLAQSCPLTCPKHGPLRPKGMLLSSNKQGWKVVAHLSQCWWQPTPSDSSASFSTRLSLALHLCFSESNSKPGP